MSYIYGDTQLVEALVESQQRNISIRLASDLIRRSYQNAGVEGVKQLCAEHGVNYVVNSAGYPEYFTVDAIEGATATSAETLYPTVLDASLDTGTNEVVIETAKSVTTQGGSRLLTSGAIKTATTALSVVGAIATGIHLGWESYKEHPDFWTDFSESIFNSNDPNTPIEVLARAHSGGYTTAVKEKEMARVIQGFAQQGCFDYEELESTITETGVQPVNFTDVGSSGFVSALAIQKAQELYPSDNIVVGSMEYEAMLDGRRPIIVGIVYVTNTNALPSTSEVRYYAERESYAVYLICKLVACIYDIEGEYVVRYDNTSSANATIISGVYTDSTGYYKGGLNVRTIQHQADNELFTNDHSSSNLVLAPTATISQVLQELKNKESNWYDDSWEQETYNPETNNTEKYRFYPITIPWWNPTEDTNKPNAYDPSEAQKGKLYEEPDPKAKEQGKEATKNNEVYIEDEDYKPIVPNPPSPPTPIDPGGGTGGTSDRLWSVYNPTLAELNDLGSYLWSNNIIDILQKFLQNPMDAVISLHKVYCTPPVSGRENIALGYLDSGVETNVVSNQFVTIDCGYIEVPEYFSDARDYDSPYTTVETYLPFVGIVRLKTPDIIGGKVQIVYTVDLYSGACLCKIFVTKRGVKQLLYNYSGNCSMQIPLTGSDRTRLLSGALHGATTGAFAGGGIGAVVGAVAGAWMGGTSIDRSSMFSANAGCMGVKKPYLIITRKYSYDAGYYNKFYGYPSNITVNLGTCRGFTKVKSVHIENILRATDNEKTLIETILKQGVIVK